MYYALVYNNQIEVGPRDWNIRFFKDWLDENQIEYSDFNETMVPLTINKNVKILPVYFNNEPSYHKITEQLAGPYYTINEDHIIAEYQVADVPLDIVKHVVKQMIAQKRWEKETGGIEVNGLQIKTDVASQAKITGAYATSLLNPDIVIDWKGANGWIQLDKTAIEAIASAVSQHVQQCFTEEKQRCDAVDVCTTKQQIEQLITEYELINERINLLP